MMSSLSGSMDLPHIVPQRDEELQAALDHLRELMEERPVSTEELVISTGDETFDIRTTIQGEGVKTVRVPEAGCRGKSQVLHCTFEPDCFVENHSHIDSVEVVHVLRGALFLAVNGNLSEATKVVAGTCITLAKNTEHAAYCQVETEALAILVPPDQGYADTG